jgi:hypothetical protein
MYGDKGSPQRHRVHRGAQRALVVGGNYEVSETRVISRKVKIIKSNVRRRGF